MTNTRKNLPKEGTYDIPVEGSLGLLALGAVGLRAWREVKSKAKAQEPLKSNKNASQK